MPGRYTRKTIFEDATVEDFINTGTPLEQALQLITAQNINIDDIYIPPPLDSNILLDRIYFLLKQKPHTAFIEIRKDKVVVKITKGWPAERGASVGT
jgi:hypothetical protein